VIAGVVTLGLSIVIGLGGTILAAGRFDVAQFERDVVVDGPETALVPGELRFRVTEPLTEGRAAEMTVGVGVSDLSTTPLDCSLTVEDGEAIRLSRSPAGTELLRPTNDAFIVLEQAELGPGTYVLACSISGEPAAGRGANFTVGRVISTDDALGLVGPTLALLASVGLGVVLFITGLVLLIVGIVRGRRPPPGPNSMTPVVHPQWGGPPPGPPPGPPSGPPPGPPPGPPSGTPPVGGWRQFVAGDGVVASGAWFSLRTDRCRSAVMRSPRGRTLGSQLGRTPAGSRRLPRRRTAPPTS